MTARRNYKQIAMRQPADAARLSRLLARHMARQFTVAGRTKRTAARLAIVELIRAGALVPGDVLPSEKELASILRVSLGTVQAALKQLQDSGTIVRRRGDGSRIASSEPLPTSIWHFRLVSRGHGQPLRFADQKVWVETVPERGPWCEYLGDCEHFVRIRRRMILTSGSRVGAEMYLDAAMAPGLSRIDPQELTMVNIRPYLEEMFGIVTAGATHVARTVTLEKTLALAFGLRPRGPYFEIEAKSYDRARKPVYYQRIFVSAESCALSF